MASTAAAAKKQLHINTDPQEYYVSADDSDNEYGSGGGGMTRTEEGEGGSFHDEDEFEEAQTPLFTEAEERAAIMIQKIVRGRLGRRAYLARKKSANLFSAFLIYLVFYVLVIVFTVLQTDSLEYYMVAQMKDYIIEEEFLSSDTHIYKSFADVATTDEFWQYMQGPFLSNMFPDDCYGEESGNALLHPVKEASCGGIITYNNIILNGIRMRQFRTKPSDGCKGDFRYPDRVGVREQELQKQQQEQKHLQQFNKDGTLKTAAELLDGRNDRCNHPKVSPSTIDKAWHNGTSGYATDLVLNQTVPSNARRCFRFSEPTALTYSFSALTDTYPVTGGFLCDLMVDERKAVIAERLQLMKDYHWVSKETRVVMVELCLYNSNINRHLNVRLVFEFPATGGVIPYTNFITALLEPMREPLAYLGVMFSVYALLMLFVAVYLINELREVCGAGCYKYWFKSSDGVLWNEIDWVNMFIFIFVFTVFALNLANDVQTDARMKEDFENQLATSDTDAPMVFDEDLFVRGDLVDLSKLFLAINVVLCTLKMFKYVTLSNQFSLLLKTCFKSVRKLGNLLVILVIICVGFSVAFYLAYGSRAYAFRNSWYSFVSCLFAVFQGMDDDEMYDHAGVSRIVAILLRVFFMFLMTIIAFSIFIAVIEDAYSELKDQDSRETEDPFIFAARRFTRRVTGRLRSIGMHSRHHHQHQYNVYDAKVNPAAAAGAGGAGGAGGGEDAARRNALRKQQQQRSNNSQSPHKKRKKKKAYKAKSLMTPAAKLKASKDVMFAEREFRRKGIMGHRDHHRHMAGSSSRRGMGTAGSMRSMRGSTRSMRGSTRSMRSAPSMQGNIMQQVVGGRSPPPGNNSHHALVQQIPATVVEEVSSILPPPEFDARIERLEELHSSFHGELAGGGIGCTVAFSSWDDRLCVFGSLSCSYPLTALATARRHLFDVFPYVPPRLLFCLPPLTYFFCLLSCLLQSKWTACTLSFSVSQRRSGSSRQRGR